MSTKSEYHKRVRTKRIRASGEGGLAATDRQELLSSFDQAAIDNAHGVLVGGGGIGSEIGEGLVRKGIGRLTILDHDIVDITNLNRQKYFEQDIGQRKGPTLAKNLGHYATSGTRLDGYGYSFKDAVAAGIDLSASYVVCGVDCGRTRVDVSRYFYVRKVPVIFVAVDYAAENGYVLIQEPEQACFGCAFPKSLYAHKAPCDTAQIN